MEVHSEVHLTGIAGMAVSSSLVEVYQIDSHTYREPHRMPSLPRDGNIDPVVRNIGRDCPTWLALY